MALNAKKAPSAGGNRQENFEPGTYPARIVRLIDLGLQAQNPWKGKPKPPANMMSITYEFLDEFCLDEDGNEMEDKPRWLSEEFVLYNLDTEMAKSTKRYNALDPNDEHDGEWPELIGMPCMVTVVNKDGTGPNVGKVYDNIANVSAMRAKQAASAPDLVNPSILFDMDEPDMDVFDDLSEWIQKKLTSNLLFEGSALSKALSNEGSAKAEEPEAMDEAQEPDGEEEPW